MIKLLKYKKFLMFVLVDDKIFVLKELLEKFEMLMDNDLKDERIGV